MKISQLTASLLTSTAVFAGVMVAQGQAQHVSADSKLRVDYSANLRQKAGTDAKIIGGLSVGETYSYNKTAEANGYTWYQIGADQWVADAGATVTGGQVKVDYAVNKRAGASTSHKILGSYYPGQVLNFTETKKADGYTWYKVGADAWVASAGVSEDFTGQTDTAAAVPAAQPQAETAATAATPQVQTPAAQPATTQTATTPAATAAAPQATASAATATTTAASGRVQINVASNLRSGAGTSFGIAGSLPAGTIRDYTATATADGYTWYQVGANAWVAGATPYYGNAATTATPAASQAASQAPAQQPAQQQPVQQQAAQQQVASGNKTSSDSAGNAYAWGQCTWYVKSVAPWAGNHWGNGGQWGNSAALEGFTVNHTPAVGSIVVVAGGQNFGGWIAAPGYGHVAYVTAVNGDSITVQQGGMGFPTPGGPNVQTVSGASSFTYIHR